MGKEVKKRMDERKKEQAEAIQELKNFACVIYDGKAIQSTYHDFYALGNGSNWGVYI